MDSLERIVIYTPANIIGSATDNLKPAGIGIFIGAEALYKILVARPIIPLQNAVYHFLAQAYCGTYYTENRFTIWLDSSIAFMASVLSDIKKEYMQSKKNG